MNIHAVLHLLGQVFLLLAIFLLVPSTVAIGYDEHHAFAACLRAALISGLLGYGLVHLKTQLANKEPGRGSLRSGPNLAWLLAAALAATALLLLPIKGGEDLLHLSHRIADFTSLDLRHAQLGLEVFLLSVCAASFVLQIRRDHQRGALGQKEFYRREGLAVVGLSWLVAGLIGALPFIFSDAKLSPVDAFFESVSGFTTTGSTILEGSAIDALDRSIKFWRSFTHWLGGIGIVLVFVVLFPTGGRSLFRSEVPGVSREAVRARVRDSAVGLMRAYVFLTAAQVVCYMFAGLDLFESLVHSFGTLATGGFSSHSESIAYFRSPTVEGITTVFMFLAGINFAVYDTSIRGGLRRGLRMAWHSSEVRLYTGVILGSMGVVTLVLWFWGGSNGAAGGALPDYSRISHAFRDSSFVVVSIQTSTGFGTVDYDQWPQFARVLLMGLAFIGACAGSTGGGLKVVRFMVLAKASLRSFQLFARPRARFFVRMNGQPLEEDMVSGIVGYFGMWCLVAGSATLGMAAMNIEPITAATSVIATLNNIGPGLAMVGPTQNFGWMPEAGKLLAALLMIVGRLEFYAVVVLFLPRFWRI